MYKLTGNKRYRIHTQLWCEPVLVLQVEYEFVNDRTHPQVEKHWRDAKVEDLTYFEDQTNGINTSTG